MIDLLKRRCQHWIDVHDCHECVLIRTVALNHTDNETCLCIACNTFYDAIRADMQRFGSYMRDHHER